MIIYKCSGFDAMCIYVTVAIQVKNIPIDAYGPIFV